MNRRTAWLAVLAVLLVATAAPASVAPATAPSTAAALGPASIPTTTPVTFAIIGDYGMDNANEAAVANLVASWNPAFIIATGDDYYSPAGGSGTGKYDESTGAYFGDWLKDISTTGSRYPVGGAAENAFFPALGNHDYSDATPSLDTYLTYFTLPGTGFTNTSGNERYYDYVEGPVHFFVLNSNPQEPDGTSSISVQAQWLRAQLASSTSAWNIVYDHHPPYSSDTAHGSTPGLQWPFAAWGADAVVSGHAHTYERVVRDGIPYFVNGLGGAERYAFGTPVDGSAARYSSSWGAQKVTVTSTTADFAFYNVAGTLIDSYRLPAPTRSAIGITRSPAKSKLTYRRRHGAARFTLSATVRKSGGAPAAGLAVYLRISKNGRTGWKNAYKLVTNSSGKVAKRLSVTKRRTQYFRWYAPTSATTIGATAGVQRVRVR